MKGGKILRKLLLSMTVCVFLMGMGWLPPSSQLPPSTELPHDPILMIHGLYGHPVTWNKLQSWLENEGFDRNLMFAPQIKDNFSMCSHEHIAQIENEIATVISETGAEKVTLIGHSRGGTAIMAFMHFSDNNYWVRNVITLAGANHYVCDSYYGRPSRDDTPGDALYTSIYATPHDGNVPAYLAKLDGARNVEYVGLTHNDFILNEAVFEDVLDALLGGGLN